ncbi:MAG: hypothetical protein OXO50_03515, partial [Caldilineaceae bacterium]|nr:hypothetical protein [Caldilineaceae bacterium]
PNTCKPPPSRKSNKSPQIALQNTPSTSAFLEPTASGQSHLHFFNASSYTYETALVCWRHFRRRQPL